MTSSVCGKQMTSSRSFDCCRCFIPALPSVLLDDTLPTAVDLRPWSLFLEGDVDGFFDKQDGGVVCIPSNNSSLLGNGLVVLRLGILSNS